MTAHRQGPRAKRPRAATKQALASLFARGQSQSRSDVGKVLRHFERSVRRVAPARPVLNRVWRSEAGLFEHGHEPAAGRFAAWVERSDTTAHFAIALFFALVALAFLATACSDDDFKTTPHDAAPQGDTSGPCQEGSHRCEGQTRKECRSGKWTLLEHCNGAKICTEDLGCVDCLPSVATSCKGSEVHKCNPDGSFGALVEDCLTEPCQKGRCGLSNCASGSQLVYVVDDTYNLLSFNPKGDANTLKPIGKMACPAGKAWPVRSDPATPFSMSVDREAKAWVLYTSGEIFWVNTKTAACVKTSFVPGAAGYELFGMGFVSDAPGSTTEKLYIFGGAAGDIASGNLAAIDPKTMAISTIGGLTSKNESPEMTGTGNAKLFGFFPNMDKSFVAEIDKATGALGQTWKTPLKGAVSAWAFAHWGGRFYIFVTVAEGLFGEKNSQILRLDPKTGKVDKIKEKLPYVIVGAGVSTCAPTIN